MTTTRSDMPIIMGVPEIKWSCVVSAVGYDPNSTSSPYATGQALVALHLAGNLPVDGILADTLQ